MMSQRPAKRSEQGRAEARTFRKVTNTTNLHRTTALPALVLLGNTEGVITEGVSMHATFSRVKWRKGLAVCSNVVASSWLTDVESSK